MRILFLGYDANKTSLINALIEQNHDVLHARYWNESFHDFSLILSYGYRHIISPEQLATARSPVVNLHIALLPFNRGAHPNFWSFWDGTPSGITIHQIDSGLDTGPIYFQKPVYLDPCNETFMSSYFKLQGELESHFLENYEKIINKLVLPEIQHGQGTFHRAADLPHEFKGWNENIYDEINRLKRLEYE